MANLIIEPGLPDRFRHDAARLYYTAFWSKLRGVLGDDRLEDIATAVAPKIRADRVISAHDGERLLGVAGFKQDGIGFDELSFGDFQRLYGWWGGAWRAFVLSLLLRGERQGELLMDGICVAENARGKGIGTRLLDAIEAEARRSGAQAIRLDVIDVNPRARALYEKRGFEAVKETRLGPLARVFGFTFSTEMRKPVESAG